MRGRFKKREDFFPQTTTYSLLPFRFTNLGTAYLLTNEAGEFFRLDSNQLNAFVNKTLPFDSDCYRALKAKHFLFDDDTEIPLNLTILKSRTKRQRVANFTSLHMFVVTLRCNHRCLYCQVSRKDAFSRDCDMLPEVARKAVEFVFHSPSPTLKIEFQGGEPLLHFSAIKLIVEEAEKINAVNKRNLSFVIATNLTLLTDEHLHFLRDHDIFISTSLDGPRSLHNAYRIKEGAQDSHQVVTANIRKTRDFLGPHKISALMTTTVGTLSDPKAVIDEYVKQGFTGIFLRWLNPFGFAMSNREHSLYTVEEWLQFYFSCLQYILSLNKDGCVFVEYYTALLLEKILTPYGTGFVNLQSPAGIGIAGIVYNYDGTVYPSDEGRMLSEMGDKRFCMGNLLTDSYEDIMLSPALLKPLEESVLECVPMCEDCAFVHYCGADPDYHFATQRDCIGNKAKSGFCKKHMAMFKYIFRLLENPEDRRVLESWVCWR